MTGACNHHPMSQRPICDPLTVKQDDKRETFSKGDRVTINEAGSGPLWKGVIEEVTPDSLSARVTSVEWWDGWTRGRPIPYPIGSVQTVRLNGTPDKATT